METDSLKHKLSDIKLDLIAHHLMGTDILDLGCGHGFYSQWLAQNNPQMHIIAVDHLPIQHPEGFEFYQINLEQSLPFPDKSFNTILAFDIIEHITHEDLLLKELYRICKPNGIIIGSVPHDDDGFLPTYNVTFYHRTDLTHKRYYTRTSLRKTLTENKFEIITLEAQGIVSPKICAEFFPARTRPCIKKIIGALRRMKLITTNRLASDIFFAAKKAG